MMSCCLYFDHYVDVTFLNTFGETNMDRKRCTYDVWRGLKAPIGQAPVSDVKVTSYVQRLRCAFISLKVPNIPKVYAHKHCRKKRCTYHFDTVCTPKLLDAIVDISCVMFNTLISNVKEMAGFMNHLVKSIWK